MRRGVGLLAIAAAWVAHSRPARACTPPSGWVSTRAVLPEDGATGVPRNARILVTYDSFVPDGNLALRPVGGANLAITTTPALTIGHAVLISATTTLEASTTYEILDTLAVPCESEDPSTCLGAATVVATFTTGAGLDTTPPSIGDIEVLSSFECIADSCPEGEAAVLDELDVGARSDDYPATWILYEYLDANGDVLAGPTAWTTIGRNCDGPGYVPFNPYLHTPSDVRMRAVDLAGNVEVTPHALEASTCALIGNGCGGDAGPWGGGDDDGDDDAAGGGDPPAGCGCGTSEAPSVILVVLVLALWPRRRAE